MPGYNVNNLYTSDDMLYNNQIALLACALQSEHVLCWTQQLIKVDVNENIFM